MTFDLDVLRIDPAAELERLTRFITEQVTVVFRRKGIVVGLSGGIDSACTVALQENRDNADCPRRDEEIQHPTGLGRSSRVDPAVVFAARRYLDSRSRCQ